MRKKGVQIHGSMFFLLKKFIEQSYGNDAWLQLSSPTPELPLKHKAHENYPISHLLLIIHKAVEFTGLTKNDLFEKFGEHLVPDLLTMYKSYIKPEWKTFGMLENTEIVMHKAVRKVEAKSNPPVLNISRVHDNLIIIDYYSERKMACLATGIIKGIAKFYNESDKVHVIPMTTPNNERVQIRVEFD